MVTSNQNTLDISLDDPVIFLSQGRSRQSKSPLTLRGQLTLTLVKSIAIRSIEVVFEGKTRSEWTEPGIGHQQLRVSDSQIHLQQKNIVFEAVPRIEEPSPRSRSVGPSAHQGSTGRRRRLTLGSRGQEDALPLLSAPPEGSFPFPITNSPSSSKPLDQDRADRSSPPTPSPPRTPPAYSPVDEYGSPPASPLLSPPPTAKRHFSFTGALHGLVHRPSQPNHSRSEEPPETEDRQRKRFRDAIRDHGGASSDFAIGTYTYPITFSIPHDSPPSQHCPYGLIKYRLKAYVHRPGPFSHKLSASADVILVSYPSDPEALDLTMKGEWEDTLSYRLFIPTKRWPIGSTTPISLTLKPLSRLRVLRVAVQIEEIISYKATGGKNTLTEPPRHFTLLSLKNANDQAPLLPIEDDAVGAVTTSPLFPFIDHDSDFACQLLKPDGLWRLRMELEVPSRAHVSCQHPRSNIRALHKLSIMLRVDNGDTSLGKRGQFDICIETGLQILSQHCQRESTLLPDPGPGEDQEPEEGQEITVTEKFANDAGLFTSRGERFDRRMFGM